MTSIPIPSEKPRGRLLRPSLFRLMPILFFLSVLSACSTVPQAGTSGQTPIPANLMATPQTLECLRLDPCSPAPTSPAAKKTESNSPIS